MQSQSVPLSQVCDIIMGQAPPGDSYNELGNGMPMIAGAGDLGEMYPMPSKFTTKANKVCQKGDIILCIRATIGDKNWADKEYCLGRGVAALQPKKEVLSSEYLWHWIDTAKQFLLTNSRGSTFKQVTKDVIERWEITLPPLQEQKRIAAILDKADEIKKSSKQFEMVKNDLFRSLFIEIFGDPVLNTKNWNMKPLSSLCDLLNGFAFKSKDYIVYSNTLNCRMSQIRPNGKFDLSHNPKYLPDDYVSKYHNFLLNDDDVIIAMTDLANKPKILGVPTIVKTDGKFLLLNQRVGKLIIRSTEEINFSYLNQVLENPDVRSYYQKFAGGGLQINLGKAQLLSIPIPVPPLELQEKFANITLDLNKLFDLVSQKNYSSIDLSKSLEQTMFPMKN